MRKIFTLFGLLILLNSCESKSNKFELSNVSASFENFKEFESSGSKFWNRYKDKNDKSRDITFDAYNFTFTTTITNETDEKIDIASYSVKINLEFKSKEITLDFGEGYIFHGLGHVTWNENESKQTKHLFVMNDYSDFNKTLFIHTPEKVILELYINASNSVGLNVSEMLIAEKNITAEWKKLERELLIN